MLTCVPQLQLMFRSTTIFAIVACAVAAPAHTSGWQITVDVFEGTLEGFFDSSTFPHLKECASDAVDSYDDIKAAISEIEQMTFDGVKTGLKDLGLAYKGLQTALTDCKASASDIEIFVKAIETGFEHPLTFLFHVGKELLINHKDIFAEITTAVADWKADSFRASGVQIGKALAKLLNPGFEAWKVAHGKVYASAEEEAQRKLAYELNADLVAAAHVQKGLGADFHSYLNEYADLTPAEFNVRNGYTPSAHAPSCSRH